ncbi:Crp/Fnr family transcriptional regulator [Clostridium sp. chh4-2]|uniref:Crp/Fnr family transcriptional regulator n=1 Tax=Clostridium sp. chh4-2 TaxID=2067550 RepID=UPI000CCEAA22|nr:Crp/Fnr family transcriptional regulator [Clostridium sp. chh4-2]PNV63400.1 Crp/Fnr family transcriptional regulator [Clostridium sp. chh4-2]
MNDTMTILKKSVLFYGIEGGEIEAMLNCLSAVKRTYEKGEFIWRNGDHISSMGLVLMGSVHVIEEDFWGNRTILAECPKGQMFGDAYACTPSVELGVSVVAAERAEILFLDVQKVITVCTSACEFHTRLIRNLLSVLADKNLMLTQKIKHMAKRSTREKLLSYLSEESLKQKNARFEIPFNRQQLADYLCVDRSAMSNELCKLKKEGVLDFQKNWFHLMSQPD